MTYAGEHKPAWDAYADAKLDGSRPNVACPSPSPSPSPPAPLPSLLQAPTSLPSLPRSPTSRARNDPPARRLELLTSRATTLRRFLKSGHRIAVRCDRRCTVSASLLLGRRDARRLGLGRRTTRIGGAKAKLKAGKTAPLRLLPTRKASRRLRRLRTVELAMVLGATDAKGRVRPIRRALRLRR
jgi:hypothetical protein